MERLFQILIYRLCVVMIVIGGGAWVYQMQYTDIEGQASPDQQMSMRPPVVGSQHDIWERNDDRCWRDDKAKGEVTGVLVRVNPNDRFIYSRNARMIERALNQQFNDVVTLDRVLAFCTDRKA